MPEHLPHDDPLDKPGRSKLGRRLMQQAREKARQEIINKIAFESGTKRFTEGK